MNLQRAAEIQVALEGVPLPATREELVQYALREDPGAAGSLAGLPDRLYERLDDVGEELVPTQPHPEQPAPLPKPESGLPPGGDAYLEPRPATGADRS